MGGTPTSKETPQKEPGACPQCGSTKLDYDESFGGRLFCRDLEDPADPESEPCGWEVEGDDDDPAIRPHLVARFGYEPIDHETLVALKACKEALDGAAPFSLDSSSPLHQVGSTTRRKRVGLERRRSVQQASSH